MSCPWRVTTRRALPRSVRCSAVGSASVAVCMRGGGLGVFEEVFGREARRLHVLLRVAPSEWVVSGVVGPDVNVGINKTHVCRSLMRYGRTVAIVIRGRRRSKR